jgi:hypothetical protein
MNKEELKLLLGRYVEIIFTLYSKKSHATGYFELFGHIIKVEDKNILFKDNYNHQFIVPITRIKAVHVEKRRRKQVKPKNKKT